MHSVQGKGKRTAFYDVSLLRVKTATPEKSFCIGEAFSPQLRRDDVFADRRNNQRD
jgi:hypothetical protein